MGSTTVMIGGLPAARVGDQTHACLLCRADSESDRADHAARLSHRHDRRLTGASRLVRESFAPHCPTCRARSGDGAPLRVSAWQDTQRRSGHPRIAPPQECRTRFPVIDGVPVLVADLPRFLNEASAYLLVTRGSVGPGR
jgi:uncharacterized protein YbaR (Trm112 family)